MGRKKIGIAQVRFDFAITPKTEHDQYIVEALQAMKDANELSVFLRSLVYRALPLPGHKPAEVPSKPLETPRQTERPVSAPAGNGWHGKPVPKPS